jgi:hypothetical protein
MAGLDDEKIDALMKLVNERYELVYVSELRGLAELWRDRDFFAYYLNRGPLPIQAVIYLFIWWSGGSPQSGRLRHSHGFRFSARDSCICGAHSGCPVQSLRSGGGGERVNRRYPHGRLFFAARIAPVHAKMLASFLLLMFNFFGRNYLVFQQRNTLPSVPHVAVFE